MTTKPNSLSSQKYWASIHEKTARAGTGAGRPRRGQKGGAEFLRRIWNRLGQRHWSRLLCDVLLPPYLEGRNGLKGLEIGSAPGYRGVALWRQFGIVPYGLEYTETGVALQRSLYRSCGLSEELVIHGDFFDDAWRARWAGQFDLVASYGFIEHFDHPEDVVSKHLELLRPGGVLVVTVPHMNEGTLYGKLVRRFNPEVYAMHNVHTCTREPFRRIFEGLACDVRYCGPLGGFDVDFVPDRRRTSRVVARLFRLAIPAVNALNHLLVGNRLIEFPRTGSTLAAVAIKR